MSEATSNRQATHRYFTNHLAAKLASGPGGSRLAVHCWYAIWDFCNFETGEIRVSLKRLATVTGADRKWVRKAVERLVQEALLVPLPDADKDRMYRLKYLAKGVGREAPLNAKPVGRHAPKGGASRPPLSEK